MRRSRDLVLLSVLALVIEYCGGAKAVAAEPAKDQAAISLPLEGRQTEPTFKVNPTEQEVWADYPKLANMMGISGNVKLNCVVEADASTGNCAVMSEMPTGLGFAAGAIHLAHGFHLNPATVDGVPVKGKMIFPIRFIANVPDEPPAAASHPGLPIPETKLQLAKQLLALQRYDLNLTQTYENVLQRNNLELAWSGRPVETQAAIDAFRQGIQDAVSATVDARARRVALQLSEADLSAAVAFFKSPSGQALLAAGRSTDSNEMADFQRNAFKAGHKRFCAQTDCGPNN